MCGFFCVFDPAGGAERLRPLALGQARLLRHRGPDWSGVYADERAVLAHERLAIVDVLHGAQPLVSSDVIGDSASCVFDAGLTQASGGFAKVFGWYDNEWGYTSRLADLTRLVGTGR